MAQKRKAKEAFSGQLSAFAAARKAKAQPVQEEQPEETLAAAIAGAPYDEDHNLENALVDDRPDQILPTRPSLRLSQFDRKNLRDVKDGIELSLNSEQSITLVGEYDVRVLSGIVFVYGAMLHSESGPQRVYALSSGALPSITAKKADSRIQISSVLDGIQGLGKYSPLFRGIGSGDDQRSFNILPTTADDPLGRSLSPLEVDEDTRKILSRINARLDAREAPKIMAVGSKSTGKSTLNRLICNMIVTRPGGGRCLYLDLDPGQPEFGPLGQISLAEVKSPLLGLSYTHPANAHSKKYRLLQSHTIAATSFKDDPDHYIACVAELCRHLPKNVPLVVNTCGWVSALGASVLLDLLPHVRHTDTILLDTIDTSLEVALRANTTVHTIPRRQIRAVSTRTPAELRAMQTMAFFHHRYTSKGEIHWVDEPISEVHPWMVNYEADQHGVAAIFSYGQAPHPDFLAESLNGMIVGIVLPDLINPEAVQRTQQEDLPYIVDESVSCSPPLDPSQSRFVGLALVRAIDETEKRIHLVSPLPELEIAALLDKQIVLVRGGFDCPEWAYLEDLHLAESAGQVNGESFDAEISDRPWVSKREAHVGIEGAIWRLRHPPMKDAVK